MTLKKLKAIRKVSTEHTRCISVALPSGLYITDGGIITHNSTLSVTINLYIATLFGLMWKPFKYYGGSLSAQYVLALGCFSQKKADELLLTPFFNVLRGSEYFEQCRTYQDMLDANREFAEGNCKKMFWTTSDRTSPLSMSNGLNIKVVSDIGSIIGQNIIFGTVSEIAFWKENGWTDDQIYGFFQSLRQRIENRMHGNRNSGFILDSSPNTLESPIDKWIWSDAVRKDKTNYIFTGPNWKFFKNKYGDVFDEHGNIRHDFDVAFPLYKGGNGMLPRVVESENDLSQFVPTDVIWCPRVGGGAAHFDTMAAEDPIRFMRDWCGQPSGGADRVFYNPATIEHMFDNNLRSILGGITAPSTEEPEHLIWNQVRDKFFTKILDKYYFYYEPNIARAVSVDQSYSGDVTGISMVHRELDPVKRDTETGEAIPVYIVDFSITIIPKGGKINLDAIKFFIEDLKRLGNINLQSVGYDGFHSQPSIQYLERIGIPIQYVSVDREMGPYQNFIDYAMHNRVYCGKQLFVKNNMLSIQLQKTKGPSGKFKYDHMKGDLVYEGDGNWDTDQRGINAKDNLDSIVGAIELIGQNSERFVPYKTWEPQKVISHEYETVKRDSDKFLTDMGFVI